LRYQDRNVSEGTSESDGEDNKTTEAFELYNTGRQIYKTFRYGAEVGHIPQTRVIRQQSF
jgi:hypothetical protein